MCSFSRKFIEQGDEYNFIYPFPLSYSAHTDCIVAEDQEVAEIFQRQVDR